MPGEPITREQRLNAIMADYFLARDQGQSVDLHDLAQRHPDLADDLRDLLQGHDQLHGLIGAPDATPKDATVKRDPHAPTPTYAGRPAAPAFQVGPGERVRFGTYELHEEIARGGMGVVYRALHLPLNRMVALKMMLGNAALQREELQRFRLEAEAAAKLDHPNIVPIYEVGEHDGQPYFSMKLIEGGSLNDHLAQFKFDGRASAALLAQVARAVHYAHLHGILHRDLKPGNILLSATGHLPLTTPYVTDFGLAKRLETDSSLTQSGAIVGTPSYMAPEQAAGKTVDRAADIYGIGAILYQMLTGQRPFQRETPIATLFDVQFRELTRPSSVQPRIHRDLETICLKCLEKNPGHRYATAELLADDLERFARGEPILARPIRVWQRAGRWVYRRPVATSLGIGFCLLAIAVTALIHHLTIEKQKSDAAEREQRHRLRRAEYGNSIERAQRYFQANSRDLAREALESCPTEFRSWEWNYLHRQLARDVHLKTPPVRQMEFLSSGTEIVVLDKAGSLHLANMDRRSLAPIGFSGGDIRMFSVNGSRLAALTSKDRVLVLDLPGGKVIHEFPADGATFVHLGKDALAIALTDAIVLLDLERGQDKKRIPANRVRQLGSSDNNLLVWSDTDGIKVHELAKGITTRTFVRPPHQTQQFALAANGAFLGIASTPTTRKLGDSPAHASLQIARLSGTGKDPKPIRQSLAIVDLCFDAEGESGAVLTDDEVLLFRTDSTSQPASSFVTISNATTIRLNPKGNRLVVGQDSGLDQFDVSRRFSPSEIPLGHDYDVRCLGFRPDTHEMTAVGEKMANSWNVGTRQQLREWRLPTHGHRLAYAPGGRWLAVAGNDGRLRLWNAENNDLLAERVAHTGGIVGLAISPDGNAIVTSGEDLRIKKWKAPRAEELPPLGRTDAIVRGAAYSPDGKLLALGGDRGLLQVRTTHNDEVLHALKGHKGNINDVAFSPDGKCLACAGEDGSILVWSTDDWRDPARLEGHQNKIQRIAFSPDSRRLASIAVDRTVRVWDVDSAKELLRFHQVPMGRGYVVAFSPDGRYLVFNSGTVLAIRDGGAAE